MSNHCKWLHRRHRHHHRNILRDQKIHITNNSIYNPLEKKITLEWKVSDLDDHDIKRQMKYDNEETRLNKILELKKLYRSDTKTDCEPYNNCSNLDNLLQPMHAVNSNYEILDNKSDLTDKTYLCKKSETASNPYLFYIFVSSSQDRANANLVYIYDSRKDNLGDVDSETHKFEICVGEEPGDCKLNLPGNLDYIFYISSYDKLLSSNVKVISTR